LGILDEFLGKEMVDKVLKHSQYCDTMHRLKSMLLEEGCGAVAYFFHSLKEAIDCLESIHTKDLAELLSEDEISRETYEERMQEKIPEALRGTWWGLLGTIDRECVLIVSCAHHRYHPEEATQIAAACGGRYTLLSIKDVEKLPGQR